MFTITLPIYLVYLSADLVLNSTTLFFFFGGGGGEGLKLRLNVLIVSSNLTLKCSYDVIVFQ